MRAVQDFNYKVALASGLKHLQAGKLRQAEEQFRYLVKRFPNAEGGYRGLARVQLQQGDRMTALATLREGAAALTRAGGRAVAIDLLRECVALDPLDLSAHRRLAAGLALAGDVSGAAAEYVRYANEEIGVGNEERARLEAMYALESFGEIPALHELANTLGLPLRTVRSTGMGEAVSEPTQLEPPWGGPDAAEPAHLAPMLAPADAADAPDLSGLADGAGSPEAAEPASTSLAPAASGAGAEHEAADPFVLEARAMALIGSRDGEAGAAAIEATRALAASGKVQAASDLLLELVASGIAVHDAERELIGVARSIGRGDLADERERLLGQAARLG